MRFFGILVLLAGEMLELISNLKLKLCKQCLRAPSAQNAKNAKNAQSAKILPLNALSQVWVGGGVPPRGSSIRRPTVGGPRRGRCKV